MLVVYSIFTRDVNFVFFQKSFIVLKKSIFFDYRIWVSVSGYAAIYYVMCRLPGGETMHASTHRRPVSHDASSVCPPPLNRAADESGICGRLLQCRRGRGVEGGGHCLLYEAVGRQTCAASQWLVASFGLAVHSQVSYSENRM